MRRRAAAVRRTGRAGASLPCRVPGPASARRFWDANAADHYPVDEFVGKG